MYIIIPFNGNPFITNNYNYDKHFDYTKIDMIIRTKVIMYKIYYEISYDGKTWAKIKEDHL